jgi:hypothetical protein
MYTQRISLVVGNFFWYSRNKFITKVEDENHFILHQYMINKLRHSSSSLPNAKP